MRNVITRTPLRITLAGGGSDRPSFYHRSIGAAINATIDKYMYIFIHKSFDPTYLIRYSEKEDAVSIDDIEHATVREALRLLDIRPGIEIVSLSDIPSKGTGLGSSSAFLVGLLNALHVWEGDIASKEQIAKEAVHIEQDILKEPCGIQDPYAVAVGGLNLYEYLSNERVKLNPIIMNSDRLDSMQENLMLLYTGIRKNANVLPEPTYDNESFEEISLKRDMAYKYYEDLISGNWKRTGQVIGDRPDHVRLRSKGDSDIYSLCKKVAEMGGDVKSIGSGRGGFLLVFANKQKQEQIKKELKLPELKFNFEFNGSSVILFN